jgi:uncharacterized membrane protein YedE/YeeE
MKNLKYLFSGLLFGTILVKSEVISWFRIQEMFHFQSFHMFGIMSSAIAVGVISVLLMKHFSVKTLQGETIVIPQKNFHWGNVYGGLIFGLGWAITGACPGPLFAQIGSGFLVIVVTLLSALFGTWLYGLFREKLPH